MNFHLTVDQYLTAASILIGFLGVILSTFLTSHRSLKLQQAETYLHLEIEAARLFEIARNNKPMMDALNAEFNSTIAADPGQQFQLSWYLPQILNLFEIAISFRKSGFFEDEIFSTWIAWFLELSSSSGFPKHWMDLRLHYKPELRQFMDCGIELAKQKSQITIGSATKAYFIHAARVMNKPGLLEYYEKELETRNDEIKMTFAEFVERK